MAWGSTAYFDPVMLPAVRRGMILIYTSLEIHWPSVCMIKLMRVGGFECEYWDVCRVGRWMWLWRRCCAARRATSTPPPARHVCKCASCRSLAHHHPANSKPQDASTAQLAVREACGLSIALIKAAALSIPGTMIVRGDGSMMCRRDARRCCGGWWQS